MFNAHNESSVLFDMYTQDSLQKPELYLEREMIIEEKSPSLGPFLNVTLAADL